MSLLIKLKLQPWNLLTINSLSFATTSLESILMRLNLAMRNYFLGVAASLPNRESFPEVTIISLAQSSFTTYILLSSAAFGHSPSFGI